MFGFKFPILAVSLLSSLNIGPQAYFLYFDILGSESVYNSLITLQFEIPNLLASVKSLQIIFYALTILSYLDVLEGVQAFYDSPMGRQSTFNEFNQYHNYIIDLMDLFNKCFGWSILVNVVRDFIFFGEGTYLVIYSLKPRTVLLVMIWGHIVYCAVLCGIGQHIHKKVENFFKTSFIPPRKPIKIIKNLGCTSGRSRDYGREK